MNIAVKTAKASFPVRRMDFEFQNTPQYWMGNDAGITHFFTALSSLFPEGEKFFVDSVRAVRYDQRLSDPSTQKEISAFIGQEAMHSKEHIALNHAIEKFGYDIQSMEKGASTFIQTVIKLSLPIFKPFGLNKDMLCLTATCALEHFTATVATELLSNKDTQDLIKDQTIYKLLLWHALEENEHKSVVFDVYTSLYGKGLKAYFMRSSSMLIAMAALTIIMTYYTGQLMKADNKLTIKDTKPLIKFLVGRKGFISNQVPELLAFFKPNFHPEDFDTVQLLETWKEKLGFNLQ